MATGSLDANGIWQYGEDDSNTTFSALLNRLGSSTSTQMAKALFSGRIIQTVSSSYTTSTSTTSTSFVSTGLTATITPRYSTSKIMVISTQSGHITIGNATGMWTLFRGTVAGTNLGNANAGMTELYSGANAIISTVGMTVLDTPATTSAVTYTAAMRVSYGAPTVYSQLGGAKASMTLIEVAA